MTQDLKLTIDPAFDGKALTVGTPDEFERVRISQRNETKRHRTFNEIPDLAKYLAYWGDVKATTVFCDRTTIKANLVEVDALQTASFTSKASSAFDEWKKVLEQGLLQGQFKEFIERRQVDIVDGITLLNVVEDLKLTTTMEHGGKYDNANSYSVIFKQETGGESAVKIPKQFQITIPLAEGDAQPYTLTIALKIKIPKSSDEKLTFHLKCWELDDILLQASNDRIAQLKTLLPDWMIYAGTSS